MGIKRVDDHWESVLLANGEPSYLPGEGLWQYFLNIGFPEFSVYQPEVTLADYFPHLILGNDTFVSFHPAPVGTKANWITARELVFNASIIFSSGWGQNTRLADTARE